MNKRFVLLNTAEVIEGNSPDHEELLGEEFSLLKVRSKVITITPFMREILEAFKVPHTPDEVAQLVSDANQCSIENIASALASFLNRMVKLGALVPEETNNIRKQANAFFDNWKETKTFKEFTLVDLI